MSKILTSKKVYDLDETTLELLYHYYLEDISITELARYLEVPRQQAVNLVASTAPQLFREGKLEQLKKDIYGE